MQKQGVKPDLTIQVVPFVYTECYDEPRRHSPRLLSKPNTDRLRYAPPLTGDKAPFKSIIQTRAQKLKEGKRLYSTNIRNLMNFHNRYNREPLLHCNGIVEEELALFVQFLRANYRSGIMTSRSVNLLNEFLPWINLKPEVDETLESDMTQVETQKHQRGTCNMGLAFAAISTYAFLAFAGFTLDYCSKHACPTTFDSVFQQASGSFTDVVKHASSSFTGLMKHTHLY